MQIRVLGSFPLGNGEPTRDTGSMNPLQATATVDREEAWLSDSVVLTLQISGPAPLRVQLPPILLASESAGVWKIVPVGNATITAEPDGRATWKQVFQLDPYAPSDALPIELAPAMVSAGATAEPELVSFKPLQVKVKTQLPREAWTPRPITDIERLPAPVPPPPPGWWPVGFTALALAFAVGLLLIERARRRRQRPALSPREVLSTQLAVWSGVEAPGRNHAELLCLAIRQFAAAVAKIPAVHRTTEELVREAPFTQPVGPILERCDRIKFAGDDLAIAEWQQWLQQVEQWASEVASPPEKPVTAPEPATSE